MFKPAKAASSSPNFPGKTVILPSDPIHDPWETRYFMTHIGSFQFSRNSPNTLLAYWICDRSTFSCLAPLSPFGGKVTGSDCLFWAIMALSIKYFLHNILLSRLISGRGNVSTVTRVLSGVVSVSPTTRVANAFVASTPESLVFVAERLLQA